MAEKIPRATTTPVPADQDVHQRRHLHKRRHANTVLGRPGHTAGDVNISAGQPHRQHGKAASSSNIEFKNSIGLDHLLRRERDKHHRHSQSNGSSSKHADSPKHGGGAIESLVSTSLALTSPIERPRNPESSTTAFELPRPPKRAAATAADVTQAKADNATREQELRANLQMLEEVGMRSTRRLDDTFYGVLEKASVLRETVAAQQLLADEVARMRDMLDTDSGELVDEVSAQLDAFGDLETQTQSVEALARQLEGAREETRALNARLEAARLRIEKYELREAKREARRRTGFTVSGAVVAAVVMLFVAVLLIKHRRTVVRELDIVGVKLAQAVEAVESMSLSDMKASPGEDPYLRRLFDEL